MEPDGSRPVGLDEKPSREALAQIFDRYVINVQHWAALNHFVEQEPPTAWRRQVRLRYCRTVILACGLLTARSLFHGRRDRSFRHPVVPRTWSTDYRGGGMTDRYSFNLIDEPWIPCLRLDGTPVDLSLRDTLAQSHGCRWRSPESPQVTAAIMRLLLAILHRVFGPADEDAWSELWAAQRFDADALDAYFGKWRHRFDLFDLERPFYQTDHPRKQFKSIVSLKHGFGFLHDEHFDHTMRFRDMG